MSFANPAFLFALGLLAVPIIIHLFNFRKYRRVRFTNVALLEEVKEKTHRASQLKNFLILLCRLLAFACLVLAFSEPFRGQSELADAPADIVSVYIDNSPSMNAAGEDGQLLLTAIDRAKTIISALPPNTSFILSSNENETRLQRQLTKAEALDEVELIRPGAHIRKINEVLKKQQAIAQGRSMQSFVLSDFQRTAFNMQGLAADSSLRLNLVPIQAKIRSNIGIDSVWFGSPTHLVNSTEQLSVKVTNFGKDEVDNLTLELIINGKSAAIGNTSISDGSNAVVELTYINKVPGVYECEVKISDNPITFDNSYYFSYQVNTRLSVFEISGEGASPALKNLFGAEEEYALTSYTDKTIDYSALKGKGSLMINGVTSLSTGLQNIIREKLINGESVAIFPPHEKIDLNSYNSLLQAVGARMIVGFDSANQRVARLEHRHPFFAQLFEKVPEQIDLPFVSGYYRAGPGLSGAETLLQLQNGNDYLVKASYKGGSFFFLYSSLHSDAGNFAQHGLFVPVALRMAETSGYLQQLSYTIGSEQPVRLTGANLPKENLLKITGRNQQSELIPMVRRVEESILVYPQVKQLSPGSYQVRDNQGDTLAALGFNLSRAESDLAGYSDNDLEKLEKESNGRIRVLKDATSKLNAAILETSEGKKLWKVFVMLALIFLITEIALTKWLR